MKTKLIILLIFISVKTFAQEDAWVYFNAKPNSENFYTNPLQDLSQRSLDRRLAQNIALDFKDVPIHQLYIDQITASIGITVMAKSKWLNCLHIRGTIVNINALKSLSFVASVTFANKYLNPSNRLAMQNHNNRIKKTLEPQITFNYGGSNNQITMLNGHILHQQNYTGMGKIVAILDAGFPTVNTTQPFARLRDNNLILGGYNYVARSNNFYSENSHGTLVLSTMAGFTDNQLVGTAPDAKYYLFVTENAPTENPVEESLWVEAAEEADRLGADIINSSLGYFDYDNSNYSHSYSDMTGNKTFVSQGANIAFTRGMVVVVSAGNSGNSANPHIASPGDASNVLTIGAVDAMGNLASFSSIGPNFSGQIKPDVLAKGAGSTVATLSGTIGNASGTSFSSPIMAGMVACLWQALPTKTATQIMQIIRNSSGNFNMPSATRGYGVPDFASALSNNLSMSTQTIIKTSVFPNPASDQISFAISDAFRNAKLTVFNVLGQTIYNQKTSGAVQEISLENFSNGLYLYTLEKENNKFEGKFIKY